MSTIELNETSASLAYRDREHVEANRGRMREIEKGKESYRLSPTLIVLSKRGQSIEALKKKYNVK